MTLITPRKTITSLLFTVNYYILSNIILWMLWTIISSMTLTKEMKFSSRQAFITPV